MLRDLDVPVVDEALIVHGHGGVFEVQESAGVATGRVADLTREAEEALEAGNLDACASACGELLKLLPDHPYARHLLAETMLRRGEPRQAVQLELQAIAIEPNIRRFHWCYLEALAKLGLLHTFADGFAEVRRKWPTDNRFNPVAVQILLLLGRPEEAATLHLPEAEHELRTRVAREVTDRELARRHLEDAARKVTAGHEELATADLRAAYAAYPTDPEVAYNWGLALLRDGDWNGCIDVAGRVVQTVPRAVNDQVIATVAFACAVGGQDDRAAGLLSLVVDRLERNGRLVIWDLPTWAVWLGADGVVAERSDRAARVVAELLARLEARGRAAPQIRRLHEAYQRGLPEFLG
jgi:tetratricopeptide (TPR) repeat protein